jgi:hypothetical protein
MYIEQHSLRLSTFTAARLSALPLNTSDMVARITATRLFRNIRSRHLCQLIPVKVFRPRPQPQPFNSLFTNRIFSTISQSVMDTFTEGPVFDRAWWREIVVYQVYVHSFKDSNGDEIGDLNGITEKLDYLEDFRVDVLWLTPAYDSPLTDMGYDIRDYRKILDLYGTMEDWHHLLDGLHERRMRLIMDLVDNHTSSQVRRSMLRSS